MAALIKRTEDPQTLGNDEVTVCPVCSQPFILTTTDNEWNKLAEWRRLAGMALRESHRVRHQVFPLELVWKVRLKR
jgi:hypothetical protein